jgi:hypothetical protein
MALFRRTADADTSAAESPATVSSGWLTSPYGKLAAVSIVRELDRLLVLHHYVDGDRRPVREPVYQGRSSREATKAANDLLQTLRLRGYRASRPGSSDASFSVGDVCRALDVAFG